MQRFYADLHIHIGSSASGRPVKITAAKSLTFESICKECVDHKGIQIAGIVDCASPPVLDDIQALIDCGDMKPIVGGGLEYLDRLAVILGAEFETRETAGRLSHVLSYFSGVEELRAFSTEMGRHVSNLSLSSQQCRMPARELARIAIGCGGIVVPAHAFTPHKSMYGACVASIHEMFGADTLAHIPAIELGLSADSYLADRLSELNEFTFLSNSDAHSLPKIGREYNVLELAEASHLEFTRALRREAGRSVVGNYGMDPRLGKYHRTFCDDCSDVVLVDPPAHACSRCGGMNVTFGVLDRICEIADSDEPKAPAHRPLYQHQVPLQFVPKVGAVALAKLLNRFGSEMAVLHEADSEELGQTVGAQIAQRIVDARNGSLVLQPGGGGRFGRVLSKPSDAQLSLGIKG